MCVRIIETENRILYVLIRYIHVTYRNETQQAHGVDSMTNGQGRGDEHRDRHQLVYPTVKVEQLAGYTELVLSSTILGEP